jgi:outer membrane receptor protein involved in Fe transport
MKKSQWGDWRMLESQAPDAESKRSLRYRAANTGRALAAAAVLSLITMPAAHADGPALEEIIVTATKRVEPIQDVPISISAITADDVRTRGLTQYADFLNSVPGVFYQDSGPGKGTIRIRGISGVEGGVPSTTATYFGESVTSILTNQGGKPNLRLVDIDRVEVLRGPQGTLFGADALAGVVRIIPSAPQADAFETRIGVRGFATAHSSDESYHAEGVLNVPLITNRLAARVVAYRDRIAGYIDNDFAGQPEIDYSDGFGLPSGSLVSPAIPAFRHKDVDIEDTWGVRGALRWNVNDQFTIDLTHVAQDVQQDGEPFVQDAVGAFAQSRGTEVFQRGGYGERLNLTSLVGDYAWTNLALTSVSSWTKLQRFANQDVIDLAAQGLGVPLPWTLLDRSEGRLFTQEIRLQSRNESRLQWLIGAFYLHATSDAAQLIPDFSCPACLPTVLAGQDFAFSVGPTRIFEQEQRSAFGQASLRFAERWTLGVGARYLEADLTSPFPALDGILSGGAPTPPTVEGSNDEFNPSGFLRFEPNADLTAYLQASRGFRSGQANQALPDPCSADAQGLNVQPITDPDTLWNYELGVKSRHANGRLTVNAAVYRYRWSGVQLLALLPCGFAVIVNGGDAIGKGAELELVAEPTDAWRMNLSVAYNHSEFDKVVPSSGYTEGQRLPDAPRVNGSAGLQRSFHLSGQWGGFIRGDYTYVGNVISQYGPIRAYDTTNVRLAFQRNDLSLELFGRNVFDERGILTRGDPAFGSHLTLTRPREVGVEARYTFK